jgi:hypothetical protein
MAAAKKAKWFPVSVGILGILLFVSQDALAHCDTMDGPVIMEAKQALEKGDITPVLKWVKEDAEPEIKAAFQKAVAVRSKGPEAKELADTYFFETLVRIHRAGEGAPYDGIKPAGTKVEPGIEAADRALETGSVDDLVKDVTNKVADGVRERFTHAVEAKKHKDESVEAGREFVEAYVTFMHYVERLHQDATTNPSHHAGEVEAVHAEAGQHDERAQAKTEHTHDHK